jgi:hypothetical protein
MTPIRRDAMRRVVLLAGLFVLITMMWALPSVAEPTILGPTGLIVNPTADITPVDHAWIALNFFDNNDNSVWTTNVTGAISEGFEISLGAVHPDEGDDGITAAMKWLFLPESENAPGAAAGVTFSDIAGDSVTTMYLVASKFFYLGKEASENASFHGGVFYTSGDLSEDVEFFAGLDVEVMQNLLGIAEYNSDDDSIFNGFTYGVRYYIGPEFTGQAAFIDGNLHIGGSYIF